MTSLKTQLYHLYHLLTAIAATLETPAPFAAMPVLVVLLFIAAHAE